MSIATEIEDLNTNLTAAKSAVTAKGGTVGDTGLAGLATEIASIPSGGGDDDPGDYGIVWYYGTEAITVNNVDMHGDNCSAVITDEATFVSAILNGQMGSQAFDGFHLDILYQQGEGWQCWEISETPMTTEDLETQLGMTITDFDPETADYASIMVTGSLSIDKTQRPVKYKLQSLEEYNRLADPQATGGQWELLVTLGTIWKFAFGRAVTEIPDGFLRNVPNLEYLDTTYADGIITIGQYVLESGRVGVRNDIEFKNATSIGGSSFSNSAIKGAMSFPNAISVGNNCFSNTISQPSLPKVETIGSYFMAACRVSSIYMGAMPALRTIGEYAFSQGHIDYFSLDLRNNRLPNLQSIGASFCNRMGRLDRMVLSDGVESLNIDANSFTLTSTQTVSYIAGIELNWYSNSTKKQQFVNAHPNSSTNSIYRKWR